MWKLQQKVQGVLYMVHIIWCCGRWLMQVVCLEESGHLSKTSMSLLASLPVLGSHLEQESSGPFHHFHHFHRIQVTSVSKSSKSRHRLSRSLQFSSHPSRLKPSSPSSNQVQRSHRLAMAAANEVARVMAEAAAMVQETWKDMAGGLGAWGTVLESWREMIKWGRNQ